MCSCDYIASLGQTVPLYARRQTAAVVYYSQLRRACYSVVRYTIKTHLESQTQTQIQTTP